MLLLACLLVSVASAAPADPWMTLYVNGFDVDIDYNNILKSVRETPRSSTYLDLSFQGLVGIDRKAFNELSSNIKYLNLAFNRLEKLPQLVFVAFENLEYLSLANNPLSNNINFLIGLNKLQTLDVSNINVTDWNQDSFSGLVNSTYVQSGTERLTIADSYYKNETKPYILFCINEGIVKSVQLADHVEYLRAGAKNCDRADLLDDEIINRKHFLTLQDQSIIGFEKGWYGLESLSISALDLTANKISRVTSAMLNDLPENLTRVILRKNKIKSLERGIIVNKNLQILDLKKNAIGEIEDAALANTRLRELYLSGNKLENNAFVVTLPSTLIQLLIDDNNISQLLPNAFSTLSNLEILSLHENKLVSLEKNVFNGLESIRELSIAKNKLRQITGDSFYGLSDKMNILLLGGNEIERLQKGTFIDAPTVELDLSNNKITVIESGTFNLPNLETLTLRYNLLTTLENDTLVGLPNAVHIDLMGNNIRTIKKDAVRYLKKESIVSLQYNPIETNEEEGNPILRVDRLG